MHFDTISVHGGHIEDSIGSVTDPIHVTTTFERNEAGVIGGRGYIYTRIDNPNRQGLENKLAQLEGGEEAFAFPSGMAAAMALAQTVLEPDTHVIIPDDCYHGIAYLIKSVLPKWRISYTEVDMSDVSAIQAAIQKNTKLIIVETPSNPLLKITDIQEVCRVAKATDVLVGCDNTWTTPLLQKPFDWGADLVFHSSTKFFGGHSDVLGGCIIVKQKNALAAKIREYQIIGGSVPSPFDCWLLNRSLSTLSLRLERQTKNAVTIADFLQTHPAIEQVYYPGLKDHPNHAVAARQMNHQFGSMISVTMKGGEKSALAFAGGMKIFKHATSLGGVESLIEHRRSAEGMVPRSPANLLRLSIGIEYIDDLVQDLMEGLKKSG